MKFMERTCGRNTSVCAGAKNVLTGEKTVVPVSDTKISLTALSSDDRNEHFKAIVNSSDDAIISKTVTGVVTSWNAGAQNLFGYSAEEMIGNNMLALFPKDRAEEESFILDLILAGERVDHFDTVRIHKNGKLVEVSVSISPIRNVQGEIVGASKIARDISDRKRLEAMQSQFKVIVESSDDAIVSMSLDGKIVSWNPGAEAIFGYSASEVIGLPVLFLLPPGVKEEEGQLIEKLAKGEKIEHLESVIICKDGRQIVVSMTTSPIRDVSGKIIGVSKIARDITARKLAETRLLLTASVFTNTNEGIVITDDQGHIVEVNNSFLRISGYERQEILGQNPDMFRSSRHDPSFIRSVLEVVLATGTFQGEVWSRKKDGSAYACLLTINMIKDETGAVQHFVSLVSDITPLREKQEQMEHLAHFDALTDLPNRILLADRLRQAMAHVTRHRQSLAVLYLDLDFFKEINDKYGHDTGDRLLVTVSHRMTGAMRHVDTLSRIGGDEFVAVLLDVGTPVECNHLAERILHACSEPVLINGNLLQISASIGMTIYPQDAVDADQLMRHADRAMYEAKQAGRNRITLFDADLENEIKNRAQLLSSIEEAFGNNEFVMYYQPKVNMRLGTVFGLEGLIRWLHPQRGILLPDDFLPHIEHHHMEFFMGYWAIETGMAQIAQWHEAGLSISISINVSANLLQLPDFEQRLGALLNQYPDIGPGMLELEILESTAMHDITSVIEVIRKCQQLGVVFSVDDFGTGYSSLTCLRRLPVETLKIDQSFVRDLLSDHDDYSIVQGVIALAHAFGRKIVGEGVENIEIGEELLDLGCDLAQGFGIARPMPADQIPDWITSWTPPPCWKHRGI